MKLAGVSIDVRSRRLNSIASQMSNATARYIPRLHVENASNVLRADWSQAQRTDQFIDIRRASFRESRSIEDVDELIGSDRANGGVFDHVGKGALIAR